MKDENDFKAKERESGERERVQKVSLLEQETTKTSVIFFYPSLPTLTVAPFKCSRIFTFMYTY